MDLSSVRVHAPSPVVFICGGKIDLKADKPRSLRDAFIRAAHSKPFDRHEALLAEDLNGFFPNGKYQDILLLESDIAQISDLIILSSESYGSAAELGAFSMVNEISQRLLVVIDDINYNDNSFISLGPLRALENKYGEKSVLVLKLSDIGITSILNVAGLRQDVFIDRMASAFRSRIASAREHTTFDIGRPGHLIKFAVGLLQHYGALTLDEIEAYFFVIGVERIFRDRLHDLLLCAEFAKWVKKDRRGLSTYYLSPCTKEALQYRIKRVSPSLDKDRWRANIILYWKSYDPDRFSCINQLSGGGV